MGQNCCGDPFCEGAVVHIDYNRSGGFAGIDQHLRIDRETKEENGQVEYKSNIPYVDITEVFTPEEVDTIIVRTGTTHSWER